MDMLRAWWSGLNADDQFKIISILLEKGLLAILLAIAALLAAILLERHKAVLARQTEFEKFSVPRVAALMDEVDALLLKGGEFMEDLAHDYRSIWHPWIVEITTNPPAVAEGQRIVNKADSLKNMMLQNGMTIGDYIGSKMNEIKYKVAIEEYNPEAESNFLYSIAALYMQGEVKILTRNTIEIAFKNDMFIFVTSDRRKKIKNDVNIFVLKAKNVINSKKEKEMGEILKGCEDMNKAISEFSFFQNQIDSFYFARARISTQLSKAIAT